MFQIELFWSSSVLNFWLSSILNFDRLLFWIFGSYFILSFFVIFHLELFLVVFLFKFLVVFHLDFFFCHLTPHTPPHKFPSPSQSSSIQSQVKVLGTAIQSKSSAAQAFHRNIQTCYLFESFPIQCSCFPLLLSEFIQRLSYNAGIEFNLSWVSGYKKFQLYFHWKPLKP